MSAWIVSKEHVDLIVRYAVRADRDNMRWWQVDEDGNYTGWRELDEFAEVQPSYEEWLEKITPSQLGQMLVNENVASVHHRYPNDDVDMGELPGPIDAYYMGPYVYSDPGYTLTPGELFKAIDCLDYQSCEHEGWRSSEAHAFLEALRHLACTKVESYGTSPWGWDDSDLDGKPKDRSVRVI